MILKFSQFLKESPKQIVDVVFGDSKRLGQGKIMGAIMGVLTKDKQNPSPIFGLETSIKNLLRAGVSMMDIQTIRNAVIRGMENTIKKEHIPRNHIEDLPSNLFERYRFYLDGYSPHSGSIDLVSNQRNKAYVTARQMIEKEIKKLDIRVNNKKFT